MEVLKHHRFVFIVVLIGSFELGVGVDRLEAPLRHVARENPENPEHYCHHLQIKAKLQSTLSTRVALIFTRNSRRAEVLLRKYFDNM